MVKEIGDPRFIIPLRLEKFKKLFGIGELQYVDFVGSWARGLHNLLEALDKEAVPRSSSGIAINPNWENYKNRLAIKLEDSQETLTSNWLRVASLPDQIRYFQPPGAINLSLMEQTCKIGPFPAEVYLRGFFTFATPKEVEKDFENVGKFAVHSTHEISELLEKGSSSPDIRPREAKNLITSILRRSWETMCRQKGLYPYSFSNHQLGFHVTSDQTSLGKRISWGRQGKRRSSMLRNIARGKVWQYGVSASPNLWPFPHFKLKSRVLFAEQSGKEMGAIIDDSAQQHRLRRTICKGWRNKAWHGRQMAYLELIADESGCIDLPLSNSCSLRLDANPISVTSPVTTLLPNMMSDDAEEDDESTLGINIEDDE